MDSIRLTTTTRMVLAVLHHQSGEVYGLRIAQQTSLATGTVYPILARLEQAGWIVSRWDTSTDRGSRKRYYQLTPDGREQVSQLLKATRA